MYQMNRFFSRLACPIVLVTMVSVAHAQVVIDGQLGADPYGPALSLQNTTTQFGDAFVGDQIQTGGGSEINGFYANIADGRLNVMVTGNLEENFNKMSFFFDTVSGGMNEIDGSMLPTGVDGFCCGGFGTSDGALQRQNGLLFDAGFEADFFLTFSNGIERALDNPNSPGNEIDFWAISAHYSDMRPGAAADRQNVAAGMQLAPNGLPNVLREDHINNPGTFADLPYALIDPITFGPTNPNNIGPALPNLSQGELIDRDYVLNDGQCLDDTGAGCLATELGFALDQSPSDPFNDLSHRNFNNVIDLQMAIDNSNFAGVEGGDGSLPPIGDPSLVETGIEFSIPLSELGNPTGDFKVVGFINGTGHDYAANQFIGDGVEQGNLGGDNMGGFTGTLEDVDLAVIDGDQFVTIAYSPPSVTGDFNNDGNWDCADIDDLVAEVVAGTNDANFDMNADTVVDFADVEEWLVVGGANNPDQTGGNPFLVGDATLDGVVDGLDFIEWNDSKFTMTAAWCSGDFTADGVVDGLDFIDWNDNKFMSSSDVAGVPEPSSLLIVMVCGLFGLRFRR